MCPAMLPAATFLSYAARPVASASLTDVSRVAAAVSLVVAWLTPAAVLASSDFTMAPLFEILTFKSRMISPALEIFAFVLGISILA